MAELAEQFRWLTNIFRGRPPQTVETPSPISPVPEPAVQTKVIPQEPRAIRRARTKEEYLRWKEAEGRTEAQMPEAPIASPKTEVKPAIISNQEFLLTREQIPWLEQPSVTIPLELKDFPGTPGRKFLFADFIHGRKLQEAANHLAKQRGVDIDKLTFTHLTEDFLRSGRHPYIKDILNPLTDKPIYCIYNPSGPRVYFMRRDAIQGFPVIIRLAACDKERQTEVLTTISDWGKEKRIKRRLQRRGKN